MLNDWYTNSHNGCGQPFLLTRADREAAIALVKLDTSELGEFERRYARTVAGMAFDRIRSFVAGRAAVHLALNALGSQPDYVGRHPNGSPAMPTPFVGSISHEGNWAAAFVARASKASGVGIDLVRPDSVSPLVADAIRHRDDTATFEREHRDRLFVAKEAIYKSANPFALPLHQYAVSFRSKIFRVHQADTTEGDVASAFQSVEGTFLAPVPLLLAIAWRKT